MSNHQETTNPSAASDVPQPTPTPERVVDQMRAVQISEVTPLTPAERRKLRRRTITSNPILAGVDQRPRRARKRPTSRRSAGRPGPSTVRRGQPLEAVEDELRKMLSGVAGANIIRRQRVSLIAAQAYNIGSELARDPANAILVPHVQEIRRLKSFSRRKKGGAGARRAGVARFRDVRQSEDVNVTRDSETGRAPARPVVFSNGKTTTRI